MGIGLPNEAGSCTGSISAPRKIQPASPAPAPAAASSKPASPADNNHRSAGTAEPVSGEQTGAARLRPAKKPTRTSGCSANRRSPGPTPAAPAAPAAPPPKLGDVLTPDERQQYSAAIDLSLSHAQTSLNSIAAQQLNKDQQAELEQIQGFMQRARATRDSDPAGAKSLSERAEVLARDLAASFH